MASSASIGLERFPQHPEDGRAMSLLCMAVIAQDALKLDEVDLLVNKAPTTLI
jgi:hypothetical protein